MTVAPAFAPCQAFTPKAPIPRTWRMGVHSASSGPTAPMRGSSERCATACSAVERLEIADRARVARPREADHDVGVRTRPPPAARETGERCARSGVRDLCGEDLELGGNDHEGLAPRVGRV